MSVRVVKEAVIEAHRKGSFTNALLSRLADRFDSSDEERRPDAPGHSSAYFRAKKRSTTRPDCGPRVLSSVLVASGCSNSTTVSVDVRSSLSPQHQT